MKSIKNLLLGLVLAAFAAIPGWGQYSLTSTTFSANVDGTQKTFAVASVTGVEVNDIAWANGEAMIVRSISGTTLEVRRGAEGTAIAQHTSGDTIYIDQPKYFREFSIGYEPRGSSRCSTATFPFDVSPVIDLRSGTVLNCTSSRVSPQGVTDMALTSPTVTTDIRSVTAGSATLGTAALPFGSAYIGGSATNNFIITGTATAARTFTLPDLASTTFAMIGGTQTLTSKTLTSPTLTTPAIGVATGTGLILTGTSANILTAGRVGSTNPVFNVDASAATVATGLNVVGAAAASGVNVVATSSGANENLTINAKGTGTIGIAPTSTGAVTITPATTITGALTPTGGVAAAGGFSASCRLIAVGGLVPAVSTDFTDSTPINTETYIGEIFVPSNCTATGIAVFNGSNVTDNIIVALADSTGAIVAESVSTAGSGADAYQRVAFTGTYAAVGPATYYILSQYAAGTSRYNAPPLGSFGCAKKTGETFGTFTAITPPTTNTANLCNVASLY